MTDQELPQYHPWDNPRPPFASIKGELRPEGYAWSPENHHCRRRYYMMPEKIELIAGKVFGTDEDRLFCLALLLENVGVDQAVQIGDPEVWKAAAARLP